MNKDGIITILEEIATLLEIQGENPFKIRAYQNGARTLEDLEEDLSTVIAEGRLGNIKGIGAALVDKITTLHQEQELPFYDKLKASVPSSLLELLQIPGLGGKKIHKLHSQLGITSIAELSQASRDGRVAALKGFGKKTAENFLSGIANYQSYNARHRYWDVRPTVETILQGLRSLPATEQAEAAGSYRRGKETVGDLDFLVASAEPAPIMEWFTQQEGIQEVTAHGSTKSSVRFSGGLQADLRVVPQAQFACALHHFTGSKEHNVAMRQRALSRGLSLSEWGLFPKEQSGQEDRQSLTINSEQDLFAALDLPWIDPALREGIDEIELAQQQQLPHLVTAADVQGVFHNHTQASDGKASLAAMAQAADDLGLHYLGIADHSQSSVQARGLDAERLLKQIDEIRKLNASGQFQCHIFAGSEVDILPDGSLDFPNEILSQLDYCVASIHSAFSQSQADMTARIIRAIANPYVTMIGHLSGRLLLKREAYAIDVEAIIDAAITHNTIIELNSHPHRLDMDWRHWRKAQAKGLLCAINPDAHSTEGLALYQAGIPIARKGWLSPDNIITCWPLERVQAYLSARNPGHSQS